MTRMFTALILSALCTSPSLASGPDRVSVMLGSYHVSASVPFDQSNPGVFLTWEDRMAGLDYTLGAYRNSFGRTSVAGIATLPVWERGRTHVGVFAGIAHYPEDGRTHRFHAGDFIPMAGLQIRHGNIFTQIIPSDGRAARAVVSIGMTFKLP